MRLRALRAGLLFGSLCLSAAGCAKDSCEVDASGPECAQLIMLELPDNCPQATVTLDMFYDRIINASCASTACHGGAMFPRYGPNDPATFLSQVLTLSPGRVPMPYLRYVKPNDPDNSFLLYKVVQAPSSGATQQGKIELGGAAMPLGLAPLSVDDQCTLVNWVRSGAAAN